VCRCDDCHLTDTDSVTLLRECGNVAFSAECVTVCERETVLLSVGGVMVRTIM
jgi:hypothetical protein